MKATTSALLMVMAAGAAMAQAAPPSQTVAPSAKKPAATATAKPATAKPATVKPMVKPAAPAAKPAVAKTATPFAKKPMTAAKTTKKPAAKPAAAVVTAAARKVTSPVSGARDPFVSPVVERTGTIGPACETGKKCLAIGTVVLRGIVKAPQGMIAVVENLRRATYFLRENDPVFNGYVVKITPDSITFRENVVDAAGKQSTRDVVKRVSAPVV